MPSNLASLSSVRGPHHHLRTASTRSASAGRFWVYVLLHASWVLGLSVWFVVTLGRFGFNATDPGLVLAASRRLLQGDIPHRDFVSARPLGFAVLHLIDFGLPGPLFISSATLGTIELVLATLALTVVLTGRSPTRWGPLLTGLVAAAALVNLHTFQSMAWYTIDGMLVCACGWWALDAGLGSGRAWLRRGGLFLLGFAASTKQSFALAPITGLLMLFGHPEVRSGAVAGVRANWLRITGDIACLVAFPLGYVGVVAASGGLRDMIVQLADADPVLFTEMFTVWGKLKAAAALTILLGSVAALGVFVVRGRRRGQTNERAVAASAVFLGGVTLVVLVGGHLASGPGTWSIVLLWGVLGLVMTEAIVHRRLPVRPLAVALLGWMTALSWTWRAPVLAGGSLALAIAWMLRPYLIRRAAGLPLTARGQRLAVAGCALLVVVLAGGFITYERRRHPPESVVPQDQLVADLGDVAAPLRGTRASSLTHLYVKQIRDCLRTYSAAKVAVLPDNAFVYPAFDVDNPFPLDLLYPPDTVGDTRPRVLDTVDRLNADGNYLVLFATIPPPAIDTQARWRRSLRLADPPIHAYSELEHEILGRLDGERVRCGSFVGVWSG